MRFDTTCRIGVPPVPESPTKKIGVAWQGSKLNKSDRRRSFPLAELVPIAKLPGVSLISLQKGEGNDQVAALTEFQVQTLGDDDSGTGDLGRTIAIAIGAAVILMAVGWWRMRRGGDPLAGD